MKRGGRHLLGAWREDGQELVHDAGSIALTHVAPRGCVRYVVDLAALGASELGSVGGTLLGTPGLWLWRPDRLTPDVQATARFVLPEGVTVSVPWPHTPGGAFRLGITAFQQPSQVALGALTRLVVDLPEVATRLVIAVLEGPRAATDAGIARWLEAAVLAQRGVFRRYPADRLQVIVQPVSGGTVTFGRIYRGGGASAVLLLGDEVTDGALPGEWVAVHELFHHGLPPMTDAAVWISEGVTQYYTEVLRGRAGFLSPLETWQQLYEGFERGRRDGRGETLAETSRRMHPLGAYRRVYWGGAAIALLWDVALRRASGGRRTLDDAVEALRTCCARQRRLWTDAEVVAWLDDWWGGDPLFAPIAAPHLASTRFPDLGPLFGALGLVVEAGRVRFGPGSQAEARGAIVTPSASTLAHP